MKKILAILLCLSTILSFSACETENYEVIYDTYECNRCYGAGEVECFHCNGTGNKCDYKDCRWCNYQGECFMCDGSGGPVECPRCHGTGKIDAVFHKYSNGETVFVDYVYEK